tara:strand:+ start:450 stop:1877 length:1428 start_codon:yes stop_codon:yes gene_type:complete
MAGGYRGGGLLNAKKEEFDWGKAGRVALGLGALYAGKRLGDRANYGTENAPPTGYQGDVPDYALVRENVLDTYNPERVAGSRGQRYFSDFAFLPRAYAEGTETGGVTVSRNEDIDAVRQAMFDQANVGPDSLRAANYARAGGTAPELPEDAGPTGIDSVLGYPEDRLGEYTQEGTSAEDFDITDPTQYQAFAGGNVYVPDYGIVNVYDETAVANFLFWRETGEGAPGMGEGEGDPEEGDPEEGDPEEGDPPAESFVSRDAWGEQASPGSYTEDIWSVTPGYLVVDAEGNKSRVATEQEAIDIIRESTPPSVNNGQNFSTMGEWEAQASPGSYTEDIWGAETKGMWLVVNADGDKDRVATEEEAIRAAEGSSARPVGEGMAQGGLVSLMGGGYLSGATDGMADELNTTIDNTQPAALSDGEFVVPADVVSHLGNGNSDAGANELYTMLDKIRMDRTGTTEQGRQINPNQYMPRGIA